ncbi:hypothetical protein GN156_03990 [bacterium LRH843]|nr:hypothetical protein [bacterium LRH843]
MRVEMTGLDEILQNLRSLNIDESVENSALNKAGKVTQDAVKNEAPVDRGTLKKNIRLRRPKDGEVVIHSGGAFHAHLIEFGRSGGSTNGKGGRRVSWGPTSPNPFFSRGFEQSKTEAQLAMITEIQKGLKL